MSSNAIVRSQVDFDRLTLGSHTAVEKRERVTQSESGNLGKSRVPHKYSDGRFRGFGFSLMVVAVVAASYLAWQGSPFGKTIAVEESAKPLQSVNVVQPTHASNADILLPANLRPWQTATLHARVSGFLVKWHKDLGSVVKAGELLAEIETPELDQELAEGESLAHEAAAAAVQAKAELAEARADLKYAEAQLVKVQAETELTKSQLVRREKLLADRAVSREDYDTFVTQVQARTADVAAAESDVERRHTNLETRAAVILAREATAKSRKSNVDRLKELQVFKKIVAPFNGTITHRTAEVGMLVTAGKESLFVIEDMSRIRVQINVPQSYAMQIAPGVEAKISLPESTLPPVTGTVTRIAESVESTSRTMLAEIELENKLNHFQPGSYAQVTLTAPQNTQAWTIPTNTLSMRIDGPKIAVVDRENRIEIKQVVLGRDLGNRVVVAEGIRGGERLVVNPPDRLKAGSRVQVSNPNESVDEIARR